MGNPTNFTSGISAYPSNHYLRNFPQVPTQWQVTKTEDFLPYLAGNYTITSSGTGAATAIVPWNAGAIGMTAGSTTPFQQVLAMPGAQFQFQPGNQLWMEGRLAGPTGTMVNPITDAVCSIGFTDTGLFSTATNGIFFNKPSGGSAVNLVIIKNGVTTTFSNVADFAQPSGLFADPFGTPAVVAANGTGTTLTSLTVTNPGFGYRVSPLVRINGTAGSGAQGFVQTGGAAGIPTISGQGAGSSIYSTYVTAAGSGYTAGTFTVDLLPWISFGIYYNGKGRVEIGVNGKVVMALDVASQNAIVPGSTTNLATTANRNFDFLGTTLTGASVAPAAGDPYVMLPQVAMQMTFGIVGTTATNRTLYMDEWMVAAELN